jgi:hypothetical protein
VFIFKDTEPSPLQDSSGVRQKGDLLGPPPVVLHPESLATQAVMVPGWPGTVTSTLHTSLCLSLSTPVEIRVNFHALALSEKKS